MCAETTVAEPLVRIQSPEANGVVHDTAFVRPGVHIERLLYGLLSADMHPRRKKATKLPARRAAEPATPARSAAAPGRTDEAALLRDLRRRAWWPEMLNAHSASRLGSRSRSVSPNRSWWLNC